MSRLFNRFYFYRFTVLLGLFFFATQAGASVTGVTLAGISNRNYAPGTIRNPVLGLKLTLAGPDTFNTLTVDNIGTALDAADISLVQVWYQATAGQFSPAEASLIGTLQPQGPQSWRNVTLFGFPISATGKLFVTVDLPLSAVNGGTLQFQAPALSIQFTSGNFEAASITNAGIQTIVTGGGATNLNLTNIKAGEVAPGAKNVPVLKAKVLASGPDPFLFATVNQLGTAQGSDIAKVKFWDQAGTSGGGFNPAVAVYIGDLDSVSATQWRNPTQFQWSVENNNDLYVTVDVAAAAVAGRTLRFQIPALGYQFESINLDPTALNNTGALTIQPGVVNGVNLVPVPADVFVPDSGSNLVFQASVSVTGADILDRVEVNNLGTAQSGSDIVAAKLWHQSGGGLFNPSGATFVGFLDPVGPSSWRNSFNLGWSVEDGDGLYVTLDLGPGAMPGRTCRFQAPPLAFQFNTGGFDPGPLNNPFQQDIQPPGTVTGISLVNVSSGNFYSGSTTNLALQVSIAASGADFLQSVSITNTSGTADEPGDLENLTLWYQRLGGPFIPANCIQVGQLVKTGPRSWQFTGVNKVLSNDNLYVTADIPGTMTLGRTCRFTLTANGMGFQYGGNFPAGPLTNSGTQTLSTPPSTQLTLLNVPAATFYPNDLNDVILRLRVEGSTNTVTAYNLTNLGTATSPTDIAGLKLWLQPGGGPFNTLTAQLVDIPRRQGGRLEGVHGLCPLPGFQPGRALCHGGHRRIRQWGPDHPNAGAGQFGCPAAFRPHPRSGPYQRKPPDHLRGFFPHPHPDQHPEFHADLFPDFHSHEQPFLHSHLHAQLHPDPNPHKQPHGHPFEHTHIHFHLHSQFHAHQHFDIDPDEQPHLHAHEYLDPDPNRHSNPYGDPFLDFHAYFDAHDYAYSHGHA